ncbi:hypothetical protein KGM_204980 [Danaus plexippus plexippus]|uniref:RING-type E3 ubiquitin transferase n=1 Tax=Danaus plexippus plexippus TaxID=278856 RepID=A0A212FAG4_DANPL|nr:hypothetical protein KGM_204980 [Danaus plexippus plexippus]
MNRHEGVSCDSCLKNNFRGRRYKCLICIDYDLCAACYESRATSNQHTTEHPMQCILSRSDFDLYYGGETLALEQPQAYTCPFCNRMGFTDTALMEHVTAEHADTTLAGKLPAGLVEVGSSQIPDNTDVEEEVVCPVCASMPGGEPNFVTDDFAGHLTLEHRTGPRDLISFLISFSIALNFIYYNNYYVLYNNILYLGIRHGGVRRMPPSGRGVSRARRTNMQFSTSGGISSLSPSSRDAVVDPIAELLSQLSGVRRGAQPGTPSQLQQLQMQLQLERQQATAARQQLERLPRRPAASSASAPPPAPQPAPQPPPQADSDSQFLLAGFLDDRHMLRTETLRERHIQKSVDITHEYTCQNRNVTPQEEMVDIVQVYRMQSVPYGSPLRFKGHREGIEKSFQALYVARVNQAFPIQKSHLIFLLVEARTVSGSKSSVVV